MQPPSPCSRDQSSTAPLHSAIGAANEKQIVWMSDERNGEDGRVCDAWRYWSPFPAAAGPMPAPLWLSSSRIRDP